MQCIEGILFGMGNPLLDVSADVSVDFTKKYGLKVDNNPILAEEGHKSLLTDLIQTYPVEYVPGGATLNVIRVAQWLSGIPQATSYVGCIGKDEFGRILETKCEEAGVNAKFLYHDSEPTGTCAVMYTKNQTSSLCANLGAANCFKKAFLDEPEIRALINKAKYLYVSGFPLTVAPDALLELAEHACANGKPFCFNMSAPFLCESYRGPMMKVMPYVEILFGNQSDAEAFAKCNGHSDMNIREIAMMLSSLPKQNGSRGRMVIITQGHESTIVVHNGEITEYPIINIDEKNIVDTNGAGEAFCGGFLAALIQGRGLEDCIRSANYAANFIIQRAGCTLPERQVYTEHQVAF